ncbi:MAG: SMP-30/gluconolactonase/LRE family protein [Fibrobacteria bacterium]
MCIAPAAHSAHQVSLPASLAAPGAQVVDVHVGLSYSEGVAVDLAGNVWFSEDPDVNTGRIWKITPDGVKSIYKDPSRGSNGLEFDNQGRLNICMLDSVLRVELDGKVTVLHSSKNGASIGRVNDLSINSAGAMFFTNLGGNTLFFRNTNGEITTKTFSGVNGVEWVEEKSVVYVASGGLQKCKVDNATGAVSDCAVFAGGTNGATDGLTLDVQGNVWHANWGLGKVFVSDSTGKELGSITIDAAPVASPKRSSPNASGNADNCHFGGPNNKTLFITGDGGLYKIDLLVAGRNRPNWPSAVGPMLLPAAPRGALSRAGDRIFDRSRVLLQTGNGGAVVGADGRRGILRIAPWLDFNLKE